MRKLRVFVGIAVLVVMSCSKEPVNSGKVEKSTAVNGAKQQSTVESDINAPDPTLIEKELKLLQGVWHETSTEMDSKKKETSPDDDFMSILTIKGDEMMDKKKGADEKNAFKGKIKIDPTKSPKRLEFFVSGSKSSSKEVYDLQGDELKICSILGGNRFPNEITGKEPQHVLVIYKRVKK